MPRITDELIPLGTVRQPTIMDGPHTWHLCVACSYVGRETYHCGHCEGTRDDIGATVKVEAI